MVHAPGFLKVVNETRPRVREISVEEVRPRLSRNPKAVLIDIREDHEWVAGHAAEAVHLGRGILERDLERLHPDPGTELLLYCGGGFRSILAADMAQRLGYTNVHSIIGGWKAMTVDGWPVKSGA